MGFKTKSVKPTAEDLVLWGSIVQSSATRIAFHLVPHHTEVPGYYHPSAPWFKQLFVKAH